MVESCLSDSQGDALKPTNMGLKERKGLYTPSLHFLLSPVDWEGHCCAVTGVCIHETICLEEKIRDFYGSLS